MRTVIPIAVLCSLAAPLHAQEPVPSGLASLELERSRSCVPILIGADELNERLAPLAARSQRLLVIAQAIALEDRDIVDSLDVADPVELEVRSWFITDGELAQRFVSEQDEALVTQRSAAREAIKQTIDAALDSVQGEADAIITTSGDLMGRVTPCDGAILVRQAVLEACANESGPVCDEAGAGGAAGRFRFVEDPAELWDLQELRPWSDPTPLQATPDGRLDGARTIGLARTGNVIVSVAFAPLLRDRAELTPEELDRFRSINDSIGIRSTHADIAFTPSLAIRATLPEPLADESVYVLHFTEGEEADVVWSAPAGTGQLLEGTIALSAGHTAKLGSGLPISLTALRAAEDGENEAVFTLPITTVNQVQATRALLGYMAGQLDRDLETLVRRREGG